MNKIELLNYWLKITGYNKEQSSFKLFSNSLIYHDSNNRIVRFFNEYDETGTIPLIYAKFLFNQLISDEKVTISDMLENNIENIEDIKFLFNEFNSKEFKDFEDEIISCFETILSKINNKTIGKITKEDLMFCFGNVLNDILDLKFEVYKKGNKIVSFENISNKIHLFKTIAECLLTIENSLDGVYLCYISKENSPDGFFGIFIKNNENIFSINERIEEAYIGQHRCMRNNRYASYKKYELFPYEIFDFQGEDYKGYATKHVIDEDKLDFNNFDFKSLMNIIIIVFLLNKKYSGKTLSDEEVYVNSLLEVNLNPLYELNKNEIIPVNSSIIKRHKDFVVNFSNEDFFSGKLCETFSRKNVSSDESGIFKNINQKLVDKFSKGFPLEKNLSSVFETDKTKLLLNSDVGAEIKDKVFDNEFIGNKRQLELQAFYELRKRLADYIVEKQIESFKNFGGEEKLKQFYENILLKNIDKIKQKCIEVYNDKSKGFLTFNELRFRENESKVQLIKYSNLDENKSIIFSSCSKGIHNINKIVYPTEFGDKISIKDLENQKECYHFFNFIIPNNFYLEEFFGEEFPDFVEGYYAKNYDVKPYLGNSILDMVDPVDRIDSFMHQKEYLFNFDFCIGFSKTTFNKLLKDLF